MGAMISAAGLPVLACMEGGYGVPEIGLNVANVLKGLEA
jgi:acetoin utilization deacetylase AcuC-like enzyme